MLKRYVVNSLLCVSLGGICLSASPAYNSTNSSQSRKSQNSSQNNPSSASTSSSQNNQSPPRSSYSNVRPEASNHSNKTSYSQMPKNKKKQATGREEIAYNDELEKDIHRRANRRGDWGYRQNWRYDSKAFFKGETQGEAYTQEHPYGPGGIGYDPDEEYLQMSRFYKEEAEKAHQHPDSNANQNNPNRPSYARANSSNPGGTNNQGNHQQSSKSSDTYGISDHRRNANNEIGYINQTRPSYPYYNDSDNNWQYDWSKQNTPRDYRGAIDYNDPYYNQEDPSAHRYYD